VSTRLIGWPAAVLVLLITVSLVVSEINETGPRRWWAAHPLTTDTVAGLLVLLVTVLVVNQLVNSRQAKQRGRAVAGQAAIVVAQASRAATAVSSALGSGDEGDGSDEFRTFMIMLLVAAPVLIDDPVARRFLERAQYLGGVMARTLATASKPAGVPAPGADLLGDATEQLRRAAAPLLSQLSPDIRESIQRIGQVADG
jgi:hypothetical protein